MNVACNESTIQINQNNYFINKWKNKYSMNKKTKEPKQERIRKERQHKMGTSVSCHDGRKGNVELGFFRQFIFLLLFASNHVRFFVNFI
jgi:hypothetical protein